MTESASRTPRKTVRELIEAYADAAQAFTVYQLQHTPTNSKYSDLGAEADVRIHQLLYVLARFREVERTPTQRALVRHDDLSEVAGIQLLDSHGAPELEFYAEAFYHTAWRLQEVLQQLPHFKRFDVKGVRDVRNHLIQHPEKARGVVNRNYAYDVPQGFILKPFGGSEDRALDEGLYVNAEMLVDKLLRKLEQLGFRYTGVPWVRMSRNR